MLVAVAFNPRNIMPKRGSSQSDVCRGEFVQTSLRDDDACVIDPVA